MLSVVAMAVTERLDGDNLVLDFIFNHDQSLDFYVDWLNERSWKDRIDWLPHDASVCELGTDKGRVEFLVDLGLKCALGSKPGGHW
jgi:hypothetical protein